MSNERMDYESRRGLVFQAANEMADAGQPTVVGAPDSRSAEIYRTIARRVAVKVAERAKDMTHKFPNIVVQST